MPRHATEALSQIDDPAADEHAGVISSDLLPLEVQSDKVAEVEGEDGAAILGCKELRCDVRHAAIDSAQLVTTLEIAAARSQRNGESRIDHLVGEEPDPAAGHRPLIMPSQACAFRSMSSCLQSGCGPLVAANQRGTDASSLGIYVTQP
jgi:hypothetical protein